MAKTNATIRLGYGTDQTNQDPVLSTILDAANLLYTDASSNVACASGLTTAIVGNNNNCIFLGNAPTAATADRQLCVGGVRSQANAGGNYFERLPVRIKDSTGADVLKYIHLFSA